jgi:hypothetical protein
MKTTLTMTIAAMTMMALTGCGPAAKLGGGKQGAASAAAALSGPTKGAADRAATPADLTDLTASCAKGGSAKLSNFKASVDLSGGTAVVQTYTMTLVGCGLASSEAGDALYDGTLEVSQKVLTSSAGVKVEQSFKGHVTIGGAFVDYLDTDVTQTVDVAALGQSGAVSVLFKGTVTNASGTYTYDEAVSVTGGVVSISK